MECEIYTVAREYVKGSREQLNGAACVKAAGETQGLIWQLCSVRCRHSRERRWKARSAPRRCERAALGCFGRMTGGGRDAGLAPPANGASAALPPLARRLVRPPHRRSAGRPRLVASTPAFRGETRPGPGSIIGCPNAAQRQGSAKRSLHPPSRLNRGSLCAGRAAAARAHASSHEPLRTGQ